jgi:hypothetical protein
MTVHRFTIESIGRRRNWSSPPVRDQCRIPSRILGSLAHRPRDPSATNLLRCRMPRSHKLSETVDLRDGRKVSTLGDAREMMISLTKIEPNRFHRNRIVS